MILAQAGEETDVILGLGYDNTLGNDISITLIATGFEHKDPFAKKNSVATQEAVTQAEKVIMHLDMNSNTSVNSIQQRPVENTTPQYLVTPTIADAIEDKLMPTLVQEKTEQFFAPVNEAVETTPDYFDLTSEEKKSPVVIFDLGITANPLVNEVPKPSIVNNAPLTNENIASSNGFLAKPAQIYANNNTENQQAQSQVPIQAATPSNEIANAEIYLVEKTNVVNNENILPVNNPSQTNQLVDETEQLRLRAAERIAKLRNLSFNINAEDPNNEFEDVPAYLRRNMDMHNQIADVESFYSNYTVSSNENNQADLNSLNNFLDGKKPD